MSNDTFDWRRSNTDFDYWSEWQSDSVRILNRHAVLRQAIRECIADQSRLKAHIDALDIRIGNAVARTSYKRIGDGRDWRRIAPKLRGSRDDTYRALQDAERLEDHLFSELFALEVQFPVYFSPEYENEGNLQP